MISCLKLDRMRKKKHLSVYLFISFIRRLVSLKHEKSDKLAITQRVNIKEYIPCFLHIFNVNQSNLSGLKINQSCKSIYCYRISF